MTREEFLKLQKKNRELECKMTEEQKAALKEARRRHSIKVRDEILTSFEMDRQRKEEERKEKR